MEDILEYAQEIFDIENETTRRLTSNSLLHYFYQPVIIGSLASYGDTDIDDLIQIEQNILAAISLPE